MVILKIFPSKGHPRSLTLRNEERKILNENRQNPHLSASKLRGVLQGTVSDETIRRVLRANNKNGRVARKKPFISEVNRKKRLSFAEVYKTKSFDFRRTVIFSDESKFNLFGSDG